MSSVWVQLYYKGKDEPEGQSIKIKPAPEDIADLKAVVLPKLDPAELAEVFVYLPDTEPPFSQDKAIDPGDPVPTGTTSKKPLRVVSPASVDHGLNVDVVTDLKDFFKQHNTTEQEQQEEKKRRLADLLFYHRAAIETGTSKSSKLAKVKIFGDGSKRCFLCGTSGTAMNKIEASHVLQKQDIYATGGETALLTLDALKNWSAGLGWKRPFRMHDPMNLIWLCHTHNLAFDRHEFGLTLGGLDNSVVFFSCLDKYTQLVADANTRLADPAQPFYDMSYVSRRAIGMRICKAQNAGYFNDHINADSWEAVVALSAAASLKHENESEDEDNDDECN